MGRKQLTNNKPKMNLWFFNNNPDSICLKLQDIGLQYH